MLGADYLEVKKYCRAVIIELLFPWFSPLKKKREIEEKVGKAPKNQELYEYQRAKAGNAYDVRSILV